MVEHAPCALSSLDAFLPTSLLRTHRWFACASASCAFGQAAEILVALKKLGEPLEPKEEKFLQGHKSASLSEFEAVAEDHGDTVRALPAGSSSSSGSS